MPRILVTNDDGVHSPGLAALVAAMKPLGDVTVVAPATEMSAVSHALTITRPLRLERVRDGVFADVHAMARLHPRPPLAAWPAEPP